MFMLCCPGRLLSTLFILNFGSNFFRRSLYTISLFFIRERKSHLLLALIFMACPTVNIVSVAGLANDTLIWLSIMGLI